jgi:hypothetical protein
MPPCGPVTHTSWAAEQAASASHAGYPLRIVYVEAADSNAVHWVPAGYIFCTSVSCPYRAPLQERSGAAMEATASGTSACWDDCGLLKSLVHIFAIGSDTGTHL